MPKFMNERTYFRHRGFQLVDQHGSPIPGNEVLMIFGDADPIAPADGSGSWKKLWDHDVVEHITVNDHVDVPGLPPVFGGTPTP